jgi:hypothetical protein
MRLMNSQPTENEFVNLFICFILANLFLGLGIHGAARACSPGREVGYSGRFVEQEAHA